MAIDKDPYKVLGVPRDANDEQIKRAYRRLALKYHPDKNKGNPDAEQKFIEVSNAYEILRDPDRRRAYDQRGRAGLDEAGFTPFSSRDDIFSAFGDVFADFFGAPPGERRARPRPGRDVEYVVRVSFMTAAMGGKIRVELERPTSCPDCRGTGAKGGETKTCPTCGGTGTVSRRGTQSGGFFSVSTLCPGCRGTGRAATEACPVCSGTGLRQGKQTLDVTVPAGVEDGQSLRLASQGEPGVLGGPAGDLLITVRVAPDEHFRRHGLDIVTRAGVGLTTIVLGGETKVEMLKGKVKLRVPAGTRAGDKLRLRGMGIEAADGRKGDGLVEIEIDVPPELTAEQRELFEKLRESGL